MLQTSCCLRLNQAAANKLMCTVPRKCKKIDTPSGSVSGSEWLRNRMNRCIVSLHGFVFVCTCVANSEYKGMSKAEQRSTTFKVQSPDCFASTQRLTTHYSLLTTDFEFTTQYSLLTTHYSLLTAHCSLLTTPFSLLTTHYSLLSTHYSLLTTHYRKRKHACRRKQCYAFLPKELFSWRFLAVPGDS